MTFLCVAAVYAGGWIVVALCSAVARWVHHLTHPYRARRVRLGRLLAVALVAVGSAPASADPPPTIEVHFSPNGGCTPTVVALISGARGSVRLAAYQFTSESVAKALIAAHGHGRDVQVIVDRSSERTKQFAELRAAGVPAFVDSRHHIFHDKFVVIDSSVVETGSFNFTESAEHANAENCVVLRDATTAKLFAANWLGHQAHDSGGGS